MGLCFSQDLGFLQFFGACYLMWVRNSISIIWCSCPLLHSEFVFLSWTTVMKISCHTTAHLLPSTTRLFPVSIVLQQVCDFLAGLLEYVGPCHLSAWRHFSSSAKDGMIIQCSSGWLENKLVFANGTWHLSREHPRSLKKVASSSLGELSPFPQEPPISGLILLDICPVYLEERLGWFGVTSVFLLTLYFRTKATYRQSDLLGKSVRKQIKKKR